MNGPLYRWREDYRPLLNRCGSEWDVNGLSCEGRSEVCATIKGQACRRNVKRNNPLSGTYQLDRP